MFSAPKLQGSNPAIRSNCGKIFTGKFASGGRPAIIRLSQRRSASISLESDTVSSEPLISSNFTSTVGSSPSSLQLSQWNLTQRHILVLNVVACVTAVSATWLFCSAIPTLLAFKRAAESLEKLLDVTREELPDTMAAVRLSGMEISDLTMELSDLGQGITQGVRSSTRAVRLAGERLRGLTNMAPSASMQEVVTLEYTTPTPMLAKTVRGTREAIIKGRAVFQMFFALTRFSWMALKYVTSRAKR
ncbi:U-box domain-containing protein [Actinidia chinensis var. chinensis]|uniref:U-box domain-containing protein n=1 Tax=Actinidia chinensis var. chinensis TaxID=1590841 RepID=A0A2R6S395_ACTCC|nr:U-box domain-containing protein [Actinidia chinensis var. chinensis]